MKNPIEIDTFLLFLCSFEENIQIEGLSGFKIWKSLQGPCLQNSVCVCLTTAVRPDRSQLGMRMAVMSRSDHYANLGTSFGAIL